MHSDLNFLINETPSQTPGRSYLKRTSTKNPKWKINMVLARFLAKPSKAKIYCSIGESLGLVMLICEGSIASCYKRSKFVT